MITRLYLRYVVGQLIEGGEFNGEQYQTELIPDTRVGIEHAVRRFDEEEDNFGGPQLERQVWNPNYIVEGGCRIGEYETIQQWHDGEWRDEGYLGLAS
jgi:hypothetical protein